MELNERHHASISAVYCRLLQAAGKTGVFRFAVRSYAEQRGRRMALRALRDGRELDFAAYRYYREWSMSKAECAASAAAGCRDHIEGNDLYSEIFYCPWFAQYQAMGLEKEARLYCDGLDEAIARGFCPGLVYEVRSLLCDGGACRHVQRDAKAEAALPPADPANIRSFEYHCAHLFHTLRKATSDILGERGEALNRTAFAELTALWGESMPSLLMKYRETNFSRISQPDIP